MKSATKTPRFLMHLAKNGLPSSVVSIDHLRELKSEIDSLREEGLLDNGVYSAYNLKRFQARPPSRIGDARSIIIVAYPQPILRATFHWEGTARRLLIPPTYYDYYKAFNLARKLIAEGFRPESHKLVRALLPAKLLAVRSGLALYGKNNITYIPKYGSFHKPIAFYSDYDSPVDNWQEKKALDLCDRCKACFRACPTGAIQKDRFLIKAHRCLTYLNEMKSEKEFPSWVDDSAHNCLVGCMRCQRACPYDKDIIGWCEDRGMFSEQETEYLLKGRFVGDKGRRMAKKLRMNGLELSYISRNLRTMLALSQR